MKISNSALVSALMTELESDAPATQVFFELGCAVMTCSLQ